ncbi:MAG: hypothetical protein H7Y11_03915, partial [Armatimonadetes bacterium]|nr:hypothetical protein [Anaerolineae bacterium]
AVSLLLIVWLRIRLRRTPDFRAAWQPPYATVAPLDPYGTAGIRQAWQTTAQNNLMSAAPTPGALQALKLLLGSDGRYLSGWHITALRVIQYDQYGRVTRSETLATQRMVRHFDRLAQRSGRYPREKLMRQVQRPARQLAKQFRGKVTARSAMLPIALDVRFKGVHGEVNIVFELYRCDQPNWVLIDRWQPEMMVSGRTLLENYTFSLYGQLGGETLRDFRRRLPDDIARLLVELIGAQPPPPLIAQPAPSTRTGEVSIKP